MSEQIIMREGQSSKGDIDFFKEQYDIFRPIKKITVYYEEINFIFSSYNAGMSVSFIAENWDGKEMHLQGLSCGYGGEGPSTTARLLEFLGMDKEQAHNLKHESGLIIHFDTQGNIDNGNIDTSAFFSSGGRNCIIDTEKINIATIWSDGCTYYKLYYFDPNENDVTQIFKLIEKSPPYEFEYDLNEKNEFDYFYQSTSYDYNFLQSVNCKSKYTGNNSRFVENYTPFVNCHLVLKFNKFDIVVSIRDKDARKKIINQVYNHIANSNLPYHDIDNDMSVKGRFKRTFTDQQKYKTGKISLLEEE